MPGSGVVGQVSEWVLTRLTKLNRDILAGRRPASDMGSEVASSLLPGLPLPEELEKRQAQQLVVLLGLVGASLGRHYQELDVTHRAEPERAFAPYFVGVERLAFAEYFTRLADRTGTGHPPRDTYASLTRWNVPTTEVWWEGERLAELPGIFDGGTIHTYTGTPDERRFFELIKISESLEAAVNQTLDPLSGDELGVGEDEALRRVGVATLLLTELRRFNNGFAALPASEGLRPEYFMDVFRQYAVHWTAGDIPPSGALDPEAIARDYLLGIRTPSYDAHTEHLLPALLADEREMLSDLSSRPSVPETVLTALRLNQGELEAMSPDELRRTVGRHPVIAALYLLFSAHARMSGVHLKIAKKYLFSPQRQRERAGLGDPGVVSNRLGTTGMDELYLEELTRARHHHPLASLRKIGGEAGLIAGLGQLRAVMPAEFHETVRFRGAGTAESNSIIHRWWSAGQDRGGASGRRSKVGVTVNTGAEENDEHSS
jgi:hypothetical protein